MTTLFITFLSHLTPTVSVIGAIYCLNKGHDGWWWFLIVALLTGGYYVPPS